MQVRTSDGSDGYLPTNTLLQLAEVQTAQTNEARSRQNRLAALISSEQEARINELFAEVLTPIEDALEDLTESVADLNAETAAINDRLTAVENALP